MFTCSKNKAVSAASSVSMAIAFTVTSWAHNRGRWVIGSIPLLELPLPDTSITRQVLGSVEHIIESAQVILEFDAHRDFDKVRVVKRVGLTT